MSKFKDIPIVKSGGKYTNEAGIRAIKNGIKQSAAAAIPNARKPRWLRAKMPGGAGFQQIRGIVREHRLATVCEESMCPNIGECWNHGTATIMVMGSVCTRACRFCAVDTGNPKGWLDSEEPVNAARSVQLMGLRYVVITSVDRDDLPDGGAGQFARSIEAIRKGSKATTIEVLTPDFRRKADALATVVAAGPDVFNHNLETVPRLYRQVRPGADYRHSLSLLSEAKRLRPEMFTKSGIMVGLGETEDEVHQVMDDLREAEVDFLTVGQYLRPTPKHARVERYWRPEEFDELVIEARSRGFLLVSASPLTRSSYHAQQDFRLLQAARMERLSASR